MIEVATHLVLGALFALSVYHVLCGVAFERPITPHAATFLLLPPILAWMGEPLALYAALAGWAVAFGGSACVILIFEAPPRGQAAACVFEDVRPDAHQLRYAAALLILPLAAVWRVRF